MSSPAVPRTVGGRYFIEQLLGRGGMGTVYRARDLSANRLVAVKLIHPELLRDPDAATRFRREAQAVAGLRHPAIVAVHEFGTFGERGAYLVMELVQGADLRHLLLREGRLEPRRALSFLGTICGAVEAAHREQVLHGDLKPENVLLPDEGVGAKVLDFGFAAVFDERRTPAADARDAAAGIVVGTPAYMAPEQLRGEPIDARTDVFSLGVIAYEMLTGELPFGRGLLPDVVLAHSRAAARIPDAPPALARAVHAALDAEPDRRPASAQALAHLLSAAAAI
jgi:serine/threonine-protein kinase